MPSSPGSHVPNQNPVKLKGEAGKTWAWKFTSRLLLYAGFPHLCLPPGMMPGWKEEPRSSTGVLTTGVLTTGVLNNRHPNNRCPKQQVS